MACAGSRGRARGSLAIETVWGYDGLLGPVCYGRRRAVFGVVENHQEGVPDSIRNSIRAASGGCNKCTLDINHIIIFFSLTYRAQIPSATTGCPCRPSHRVSRESVFCLILHTFASATAAVSRTEKAGYLDRWQDQSYSLALLPA